VLEKKRLIEQSDNEVSVLGVTTRGSLGHAADMYHEAEPSPYEQASVSLAEIASISPVRRSDVTEKIGDAHHLTSAQMGDFLNRAEEIGFVDKEGDGDDHRLPKARPIAFSDSPRCQRSHNSVLSAAVKPRRYL
jgi:hypothetical protein